MKIKAVIAYNGSGYSGFQLQKHCSNTIAGRVEQALFDLYKQEVRIYGAGRTDSGVHAIGQVIHFYPPKEYEAYKVRNALNYYLKNSQITVLDVAYICEDFHARFSAKQRSYVYKIYNHADILPFYNQTHWSIKNAVNVQKLEFELESIVGHHDFSSFRSSGCQASSAMRTIDSIEIMDYSLTINEIWIKISAPSFLYHQVRNIVGNAIAVAINKKQAGWLKKLLNAKDHSLAMPMAPAHGLYFYQVQYH